MPLTLWILGSSVAAAGTWVWLGEPVDTTVAPTDTHLPVASLVAPPAWGAAEQAAVDALAAEVEAVLPLLDAFDGELEIMARLQQAVDAVPALAAPDHREVLLRANLLLGLAVSRYFQDMLPTDAAAEPYREAVGGTTVPRAWRDAVALAGPDVAPLPGLESEPAWASLDGVKVTLGLQPRGSVAAAELPEGCTLVVDGLAVSGARAQVIPGRHHASLACQEGVAGSWTGLVAPGAEVLVTAGLRATDVDALRQRASEGAAALAVPPALLRALAGRPEPVRLARPGSPPSTWLLAVDMAAAEVGGQSALNEAPATSKVPGREEGERFALRAAATVGWLYDGDFYTLNATDGAPHTVATANSVTGGGQLGASLRLGGAAVAGGVDLLVPLGPWHTLPTGPEAAPLRLRAHPWLGVGLPWLQACGGALFPWHATAGLRGVLPLGPVEVVGGGMATFGLTRDRDVGDPLDPATGLAAWLGVGGAWRL